MAVLAVFGIENDGLNLAVNLLLLFLVVIWLRARLLDLGRRPAPDRRPDAGRPARRPRRCFPFIGTIVYLIVRPPEYLDDVRERELEIAAAEARLASSSSCACPYCGFDVEKTFLRCPNCLRRLKEPCTSAASRSTRAGRSARTARPRSARPRPERAGGRGQARRRGAPRRARPRPRQRASAPGPRSARSRRRQASAPARQRQAASRAARRARPRERPQ